MKAFYQIFNTFIAGAIIFPGTELNFKGSRVEFQYKIIFKLKFDLHFIKIEIVFIKKKNCAWLEKIWFYVYISYKNYFYLIVGKIIITSFVITCIKIILSKCCTNVKSLVKLQWPHKFFWMKTFDKVQMWTFHAYIDQFSAVIAVNMIDKHAPRFETRLDRFLLRRVVLGYSGCSWIILQR